MVLYGTSATTIDQSPSAPSPFTISTRTMLVSIAEEMNPTRRNTQEDVHVVHGAGSWGAPNVNATFIGVMDGHGGRQTVDYLEQHLAKNVANEWRFAAKESDGRGESNRNNSGGGDDDDEDDAGSSSEVELLQPPKKRIKETNADTIPTHLSPTPSALLDTESKAIRSALERAFLITDIQSRIDGIITSGATVACCIVVPNFSPQNGNLTSITIHAANAGDARAVLSSGTAQRRQRRQCSNKNNNRNEACQSKPLLPNPELANELPLIRGTHAIRITHDHKSTDPVEISRIQSAGGIIIRGRVMGVLAVARSLGDHGLKEFVIAKPYLSSTTVRMVERKNHYFDDDDDEKSKDMSISSPHQAPFTEDEFLVVACDGLWDVMDDQEVIDFIRKFIHVQKEDSGNDIDLKQSREAVATFVVEEALKRGSTDNITVIVYWL